VPVAKLQLGFPMNAKRKSDIFGRHQLINKYKKNKRYFDVRQKVRVSGLFPIAIKTGERRKVQTSKSVSNICYQLQLLTIYTT
jgi:hypothetical protein